MRNLGISLLVLLVAFPVCAAVQSLGPRGIQGLVGGCFVLFGVGIAITQRVGVGEPEPAFVLEGGDAVAVGVVCALIGMLVLLSSLSGASPT